MKLTVEKYAIKSYTQEEIELLLKEHYSYISQKPDVIDKFNEMLKTMYEPMIRGLCMFDVRKKEFLLLATLRKILTSILDHRWKDVPELTEEALNKDFKRPVVGLDTEELNDLILNRIQLYRVRYTMPEKNSTNEDADIISCLKICEEYYYLPKYTDFKILGEKDRVDILTGIDKIYTFNHEIEQKLYKTFVEEYHLDKESLQKLVDSFVDNDKTEEIYDENE